MYLFTLCAAKGPMSMVTPVRAPPIRDTDPILKPRSDLMGSRIIPNEYAIPSFTMLHRKQAGAQVFILWIIIV